MGEEEKEKAGEGEKQVEIIGAPAKKKAGWGFFWFVILALIGIAFGVFVTWGGALVGWWTPGETEQEAQVVANVPGAIEALTSDLREALEYAITKADQANFGDAIRLAENIRARISGASKLAPPGTPAKHRQALEALGQAITALKDGKKDDAVKTLREVQSIYGGPPAPAPKEPEKAAAPAEEPGAAAPPAATPEGKAPVEKAPAEKEAPPPPPPAGTQPPPPPPPALRAPVPPPPAPVR